MHIHVKQMNCLFHMDVHRPAGYSDGDDDMRSRRVLRHVVVNLVHEFRGILYATV